MNRNGPIMPMPYLMCLEKTTAPVLSTPTDNGGIKFIHNIAISWSLLSGVANRVLFQ